MILCECLLPLSSSLSLQQSANPSSSTSSPSLLLAVTKPPHAITHNHAQSRTITSTLSPSPLHFHFPLLLVGVPPFQLTSSSKPRQQNPWTALCSAPSSVHCIARTADTQRTSPTSPLMTAGNGEEGGVCCPLSLELSRALSLELSSSLPKATPPPSPSPPMPPPPPSTHRSTCVQDGVNRGRRPVCVCVALPSRRRP